MNNNNKRRIMNNLKKLGVTALAGSLAAVSAQAGEMSMNGSANMTYYTTSNSTASDNVNNFTKANFDLAGLSGGNGCWDSSSVTTAGYGTTKAYLTNDSLVTATDNNSCDAATRMVGDVQLATPITITSEVQSYGLTWQITDIGLWVIYPGNGDAPSEFGMGPFLPKFNVE